MFLVGRGVLEAGMCFCVILVLGGGESRMVYRGKDVKEGNGRVETVEKSR